MLSRDREKPLKIQKKKGESDSHQRGHEAYYRFHKSEVIEKSKTGPAQIQSGVNRDRSLTEQLRRSDTMIYRLPSTNSGIARTESHSNRLHGDQHAARLTNNRSSVRVAADVVKLPEVTGKRAGTESSRTGHNYLAPPHTAPLAAFDRDIQLLRSIPSICNPCFSPSQRLALLRLARIYTNVGPLTRQLLLPNHIVDSHRIHSFIRGPANVKAKRSKSVATKKQSSDKTKGKNVEKKKPRRGSLQTAVTAYTGDTDEGCDFVIPGTEDILVHMPETVFDSSREEEFRDKKGNGDGGTERGGEDEDGGTVIEVDVGQGAKAGKSVDGDLEDVQMDLIGEIRTDDTSLLLSSNAIESRSEHVPVQFNEMEEYSSRKTDKHTELLKSTDTTDTKNVVSISLSSEISRKIDSERQLDTKTISDLTKDVKERTTTKYVEKRFTILDENSDSKEQTLDSKDLKELDKILTKSEEDSESKEQSLDSKDLKELDNNLTKSEEDSESKVHKKEVTASYEIVESKPGTIDHQQTGDNKEARRELNIEEGYESDSEYVLNEYISNILESQRVLLLNAAETTEKVRYKIEKERSSCRASIDVNSKTTRKTSSNKKTISKDRLQLGNSREQSQKSEKKKNNSDSSKRRQNKSDTVKSDTDLEKTSNSDNATVSNANKSNSVKAPKNVKVEVAPAIVKDNLPDSLKMLSEHLKQSMIMEI